MGNIWIGKQQMVRKVEPWHLKALNKDLEREKKNVHYCLNPYLTPEQERLGHEERNKNLPRIDQLAFKIRKAKIEATHFKEVRVEEGIAKLKHNVSWE